MGNIARFHFRRSEESPGTCCGQRQGAHMCYILLLSTSSDRNLAEFNTELVRFSEELPTIADAESLRYRHKWYIGSKSGCSCTFRHICSTELGFGAPVDWCPEDPEEIAATARVISIIRKLVENGESVDCIDAWEHHRGSAVAATLMQVDLAGIDDGQFRFFENHHFVFSQASGQEGRINPANR